MGALGRVLLWLQLCGEPGPQWCGPGPRTAAGLSGPRAEVALDVEGEDLPRSGQRGLWRVGGVKLELASLVGRVRGQCIWRRGKGEEGSGSLRQPRPPVAPALAVFPSAKWARSPEPAESSECAPAGLGRLPQFPGPQGSTEPSPAFTPGRRVSLAPPSLNPSRLPHGNPTHPVQGRPDGSCRPQPVLSSHTGMRCVAALPGPGRTSPGSLPDSKAKEEGCAAPSSSMPRLSLSLTTLSVPAPGKLGALPGGDLGRRPVGHV